MAKHLSEDDLTLLEHAMRDVTPLKRERRVLHQGTGKVSNSKVRRLRAMAHQSPDRIALSDAQEAGLANTEHSYRISSLPSDALRRLRRQSGTVKASLDLHGLTIEQARRQLHDFIHACAGRGYKRVRIIHGQGFGSSGGQSVLRLQTRHWLSQMPQVLGFVSPPPSDGGEGAVLVLLRSANKIDQV